MHAKWADAVAQLKKQQAYLTEMEGGIDDKTLRVWRTRLEAFYVGVRDIKKHKEMDNPFVADVDRGK